MLKNDSFDMYTSWDFDQIVGYFKSCSAVNYYIEQNKSNPIDLIKDDLRKLWGDEKKTMKWNTL